MVDEKTRAPARRGRWRSQAAIHDDVEYAVDDAAGVERVTHEPDEAKAMALDVAIARGEAKIDVLIYSEKGARAFGGDDAVEMYREDPDASVFTRYEIRVNAAGRVP
jgi:hypothetical protein